MPFTRRTWLATAAAAVLAPPSLGGEANAAAFRGATLEDVLGDLGSGREGGRRKRARAGAAIGEQIRVTSEGLRVLAYARFSGVGAATDQWPLAPLGGDRDVYLGAGGDGIGFVDGAGSGAKERKKLVFSSIRLVAAGDNIRCTPHPTAAQADIAGYDVRRKGDDLKPNALFFDQATGDAYCFVARGRDENRRRAWLIASGDRGRSWNVGDLPPLPRDPAFDANAPGRLTPVGVCNRPEGSVHPDGHLYFYFNRQGNAKSRDLYRGNRALRPVYCARIPRPGGGSLAARRAHFADAGRYQFWTGGGWGPMAAAAPIHDPGVDMGKHFLVWWIPALSRYVAAKTHSMHNVWLGASNRPEGPFTTLLDRKLSGRGRDDIQFTAQVLPHPAIVKPDGIRLPLVFSGHPNYDGLYLAKVRFA